ncbi:hypothetical protein ACFV4P_33915 [Kitasatospora sp. NPDC059795]
MRRAVLFDLDGVLPDSHNARLATPAGYAMSALGRRRGHPHHLQAPLQY